MPSNITLLAENILLKKKLEVAQNWMRREISGQKKSIAQKKVTQKIHQRNSHFLGENIEDIINKKIQEFFGDIVLSNIPAKILQNIVSAEMSYYHFRHNPKLDGFSVISSYHKALDIIIEEFITSGFRKFVDKNRLPNTIDDNHLEKSLNKVIMKNYTLSIGRVFHLTQVINNPSALSGSSLSKGSQKIKLPLYTYLFSKYIRSNIELKELILEDDNFYTILSELIASQVLGEKRHHGRIDFVETRSARKLLIGEFKEKECLIYKLIKLGEV